MKKCVSLCVEISISQLRKYVVCSKWKLHGGGGLLISVKISWKWRAVVDKVCERPKFILVCSMTHDSKTWCEVLCLRQDDTCLMLVSIVIDFKE